MFQFRKKPVIIEAYQHRENDDSTRATPQWLLEAATQGVIFDESGKTMIRTLEGNHEVSDGDWIIRGVKGELYPCKPDIFALTYDSVD